MTRTWAICLGLLALPGCDVAVAGLLASRSSKSSSSGGSGTPPPPSFKIYVAKIADLSGAKSALDSSGGVPAAPWVFHTSISQTSDLDFSSLLGGPFDTILLQAPDTQAFDIDAIEVIDVNGSTLETALASELRANGAVADPAPIEGFPDGLTMPTDPTEAGLSFVIARFSADFSRVRVSFWGASLGSGDVAWVSTYVPTSDTADQRAGGAALQGDSVLFVAINSGLVNNRNVELLKLNVSASGGAPVTPTTPLENGVTAGVGSQSVQVHSSGDVYVAWTAGAGSITVRRYNSNVSGFIWTQTVANVGSTPGRVEAHGLAVDTNGHAYVAGGIDFGIASGFAHFLQQFALSDGSRWLLPSSEDADANPTYWLAVTATVADLFTTGDFHLGTLTTPSIEILTRKSGIGSQGALVWRNFQGGLDNLADVGRCIKLHSSGDLVVGGSLSTAVEGRNAVVVRTNGAGNTVANPYPLVFNGTADGDDEVNDLELSSDGFIYTVGYETVSGQGKNLWLRKWNFSTGAPVWTRTVNGSGNGDDQAVSVVLSGSHIYVVGEVTQTGTGKDIHVRKYVR